MKFTIKTRDLEFSVEDERAWMTNVELKQLITDLVEQSKLINPETK